jgi:hypothetical protein
MTKHLIVIEKQSNKLLNDKFGTTRFKVVGGTLHSTIFISSTVVSLFSQLGNESNKLVNLNVVASSIFKYYCKIKYYTRKHFTLVRFMQILYIFVCTDANAIPSNLHYIDIFLAFYDPTNESAVLEQIIGSYCSVRSLQY